MIAPRSSVLASLCLLLLLGLAGCHDDDPKLDELIVEGEWLATITETADSCDGVVEPVTDVSVFITDEGDHHLIQVDNLDLQRCWVQPFTLDEQALSWSSGATQMTHDCNEDCVFRVESTMTLELLAGGAFTGTEVVTYMPLNAACDHPDCAFPCDQRDRHVLFPPLGAGCAFSCETTYAWSGAIGGDVAKACL